jgi:hypothetical protein
MRANVDCLPQSHRVPEGVFPRVKAARYRPLSLVIEGIDSVKRGRFALKRYVPHERLHHSDATMTIEVRPFSGNAEYGKSQNLVSSPLNSSLGILLRLLRLLPTTLERLSVSLALDLSLDVWAMRNPRHWQSLFPKETI